MSATIISLLSGVAAIVGGYFALKTNPNRLRRQAEKDVMDKEAEIESKKQELREAVYSNDDEKLNQIASKLIAPLLLSACCLLTGCQSQPKTVYIPTDRRIESCTNSLGISCKAVPDAVFVEMSEKLIELKELKRTAEVDKRLTKQQ